EYDEEIIERQGNGIENLDSDFEENDELINEAREIVINSERASISFLQRKMRIGYNKAAGIIDALESLGVVGPADGAKGRQVLIPRESLENAGVDKDEEENEK
ncbi:MAG: DNA translocase FtsK, partial [Patescibacteria group bacterium]|nr:DNA translocase FtsK [Patescibacteria group bacterium]